MDHKKCGCKIKTWSYEGKPFESYDKCRKRAGGIIIHVNKIQNKKQVLMVQSRGTFWGLPKGSIEGLETPLECAKREILEETSIDLPIKTQDFFIYHNRTYYYMKIVTSKPRIDIEKIKSIKFNDCTGVAWIDIDCLDNIKSGKMRLNSSAKEIVSRISNPSFSHLNSI
jgi:ADP-ribose pyrophosphatase YjhB (NUDIX family)